MNRVQAQKRIVELRQQIRHHDYCYYVLARPEISDYAYDQLYKRLIERVDLFDVSSSFAMEQIKFTTALPVRYMQLD